MGANLTVNFKLAAEWEFKETVLRDSFCIKEMFFFPLEAPLTLFVADFYVFFQRKAKVPAVSPTLGSQIQICWMKKLEVENLVTLSR